MTGPLGLDPDDLASCVACGLCLPHCPTFRVTGRETASPRGRLAAMRAVEEGAAADDAEFVRAMEECVQCRGCEAACPSAVPFGALMAETRAAMVDRGHPPPRRSGPAHRILGHPRLLRAGSSALAVAQRLRLVPRRLGLPRLPVRRVPHRSSGDDVWLFTGCVMDAWDRATHQAVQRVLEATGLGVTPTGDRAPCCGALDLHAGRADPARARARQVMAALPGDAPILVDSAGCGAVLADYGRVLVTPEAVRFSARVRDVHEVVAERQDRLRPRLAGSRRDRVAVHDPCHLRHVRGAHTPVHTVVGLVAEPVALDDDGLCCGAGGAYAALEPGMAGAIRARKLAAIDRTGAAVVASANPGCTYHLAAAGVEVHHPLVLVDRALGPADPAAPPPDHHTDGAT